MLESFKYIIVYKIRQGCGALYVNSLRTPWQCNLSQSIGIPQNEMRWILLDW